jgi:hypothetical protein
MFSFYNYLGIYDVMMFIAYICSNKVVTFLQLNCNCVVVNLSTPFNGIHYTCHHCIRTTCWIGLFSTTFQLIFVIFFNLVPTKNLIVPL